MGGLGRPYLLNDLSKFLSWGDIKPDRRQGGARRRRRRRRRRRSPITAVREAVVVVFVIGGCIERT